MSDTPKWLSITDEHGQTRTWNTPLITSVGWQRLTSKTGRFTVVSGGETVSIEMSVASARDVYNFLGIDYPPKM